ncbi:uncharacterized protein LOC143736761 [Siphateles boraxobius]|uniref:uncharacterized protein LOC143736761 n=1 Tax=Siphateles boraxobius TaxID=180520 RepID=UPI004063D860
MKKLFKSLWILLGLLLIQEMVNGAEENVALRQTSTQSSTYGTSYAEYAVDGVRDSFSDTNPETDPWWRVDLMKVYRVNRVAITNRLTASFYSRINGAVIRVGNFLNIYSNTICAVISTIHSGATATFSCGGMEGRYVIVHIPGNEKILALAEVEVYGYLAGNLAVDGAATQSSTSGHWFAVKAIDGNRGLQQLYTGCSSTLNETNPWWRLDLKQIYRVSRVVVTNRNDCCAERINGAEIHIGNSLENNGNNNPICAVIPAIPAGESYNYSCGGMDGRFVNLIIPGDMKTLTLCELEVYGHRLPTGENAALWGKTTQSSIYADSFPEFAIDGSINSWTHTNAETDPWWRVDLLKVYSVNRVTITNRISNANRINGAVIRVGNFLGIYSNNLSRCAVISSLAASATGTYSCGGMKGRYVIVHIPGDQKILSISEAGVYGYLAGNLAVDGAATQSSTSGHWFAVKAIDGNRGLQQLYTGCSSTLNETNPWWRLDLKQIYRVSRVVVTNRNDCCAERINGAEIRIGNSLENNGNNNPICAVIPAIPAGESYNYSCGGMDGRFVNLIIPGDMKTLTLCELEVYGEGPCLKRTFVRMQFNSINDLTDPSMREKVLKPLGSALADRGFTNVTLGWSQTPKRVIQKVNNDKRRCSKAN